MALSKESIQRALDAGFSAEEIAERLRSSPQVKTALEAGYSEADVFGRLGISLSEPPEEGMPTGTPDFTQPTPQDARAVFSEDSPLSQGGEGFARGAGRGLTLAKQGVEQFAARRGVGQGWEIRPEEERIAAEKKRTAGVEDSRRELAKLEETYGFPATAGAFAGEVLPFLPFGTGAVPMSVRGQGALRRGGEFVTKQMAPTGISTAAMGEVMPVGEGESSAQNALMSGGIGAAIPVVGPIARNLSPTAIKANVQKIFPGARTGKSIAAAKDMADPAVLQEAERLRAAGMPLDVAEATNDPILLREKYKLAQEAGDPNVNADVLLRSQGDATEQALGGLRGAEPTPALARDIDAGYTATRQVESDALRNLEGAGLDVPTMDLQSRAVESHKVMKKQADDLYKKVKNLDTTEVPVPGVLDMAQEIMEATDGAFARRMPSVQNILSRAQEGLVEVDGKALDNITLGDFKSFRENVGSYASELAGTPQGYQFKTVLKALQKAEDDFITANPGHPDIIAWREARDFYRDTYAPAFKEGRGAKILWGNLDHSKIADEFFPSGPRNVRTAKSEFDRIYGDSPEAKAALLDSVRADAFFKSQDPNTGGVSPDKMRSWLSSHQSSLKEYGLDGEFSSLRAAMDQAKQAGNAKATFGKKMLADEFDVFPEDIPNVLLGGGKVNEVAITRAAEINPEATKSAIVDGLQELLNPKGWRDIKDVRNTANKLQDTYARLKPALERTGLYTPDELEAMDLMYRGVQRVGTPDFRALRDAPGGGDGWNVVERMGGYLAYASTGVLAAYPVGRTLASSGNKRFNKYVREHMVKALSDPAYADDLANYARKLDAALAGGATKKAIDKLASDQNTRLLTWGAYGAATRPDAKPEPEPEKFAKGGIVGLKEKYGIRDLPPGMEEDGYIFTGGDPKVQANWRKK